MPPRIQPHRLSTPSSCQCFRTRPHVLPNNTTCPSQTRQFHPRPMSKATRLRKNMWEWLNGPGKAFREPLQGSTNYMSAYDKQGNLMRTKRQRQQDNVVDENVISEAEEEAQQAREKVDGKDEKEIRENFEKRAAAREANKEAERRGGIPLERPSDMRPYPLNPNFRSESVLSEALREELFRQVKLLGMDISTISAAFGVDLRRVAAVVRLKSIEKKWLEDGKQLATAYNDAVLAMLPQTPYKPGNPKQAIFAHESVNDLPVHPHTRQQMFYPVSESRQFTREDAAKAFSDTLLPADKRIPHPELITLEKEHLEGLPRDQRWARQQQRDLDAREARGKAEAKKKAWQERSQRVVETRRWNFKFQDISVEKVGKDGRGKDGVGARYGMAHLDRKRGQIKIPTSVE